MKNCNNSQPVQPIQSLGDLLSFYDQVQSTWNDAYQNKLRAITSPVDYQAEFKKHKRLLETFDHYRTMIEVDDYRMRDQNYFELKKELKKVAFHFPIGDLSKFETMFNYFETLKLA